MRLFILLILCTASVFSENTVEITHLSNSCIGYVEKDQQERIVKVAVKNSDQEIVCLEEAFYNGMSCTITDYAYHDGDIRHISVSYYEEDKQGRVIKRILGLGTDNEQVTEYTYTDSGKILTVHSPNGVIINYAYDEDENLIEIKSTDGTVHYTLIYNGNSTQQIDHINNAILTRELAENEKIKSRKS